MKKTYFILVVIIAANMLTASGDQGVPKIGSCQIFPSDNPWNVNVSDFPVHPNSDNLIKTIGSDSYLHPDFGWDQYGIPYEVVDSSQPLTPVTIVWYPEESDKGPFPIPLNSRIEGDGVGDAHIIVIDQDACKLYELYAAKRVGNGFEVGSAAVFDLTSNKLRTENWPTSIDEVYGLTSADAAGLPIFPGLVRYDEVKAGAINHAIRFTANKTRREWIYPATHQAGSTDDLNAPPMGLRVRLKADYDISDFTGEARVILEAMKTYGMMLADNGSNWYFQGSMDSRWNDEELNQLKRVPGSAFEVVDTSSMDPQFVSQEPFSQDGIPSDNAPWPFKDTPPSNPYFAAIEYVKAQDIVQGYSDNTYRSNQTINRAEFTKIVVRAVLGYDPDKDPSGYDIYSLTGLNFHDLVSGSWYNPFLRDAFEHAIISGYPDGTFRPADKISYAETAKILALSFNLPHEQSSLWYKPYTDALSKNKITPDSIATMTQKITRGEMAEMIYRLKSL